MDTLKTRSIYHDLMREFVKNKHELFIVSPLERREMKGTKTIIEDGVNFLNIKTLNIQKTNIIEKGLATLSLEHIFLNGIKKHYKNVKFDLIIYTTPPITFTKIIKYVKKRDGSKSYLLLKDIFPQNAIDMKLISENGWIHRFFRKKEQELYDISDTIGCMSEANRKYVIQHNPNLPLEKVEVNPNSIEIMPFTGISDDEKNQIKKKYDLPKSKKIFMYGGNLGKPQGLDFLLETIKRTAVHTNIFFLIVGSGTEYNRISRWFQTEMPANAKLFSSLPKPEFDNLMQVCDVGMIFLDRNFTIPNFPSRLLSYLEFKLPVLVAADPCTDIGVEVENHKCGFSVLSGDTNAMTSAIDKFSTMSKEEFNLMRNHSRQYLEEHFLVKQSYEKIIDKI